MVRFAISVCRGRVAPVFDVSRELIVYEAVDGELRAFAANLSAVGYTSLRASLVKKMGIEVLLCGAVSCVLRAVLVGLEIEVIPFIAGGVDDVLQAYCDGGFDGSGFRMPGCS